MQDAIQVLGFTFTFALPLTRLTQPGHPSTANEMSTSRSRTVNKHITWCTICGVAV